MQKTYRQWTDANAAQVVVIEFWHNDADHDEHDVIVLEVEDGQVYDNDVAEEAAYGVYQEVFEEDEMPSMRDFLDEHTVTWQILPLLRRSNR